MEPYCISLRSVNWMKWMFALPKEMLSKNGLNRSLNNLFLKIQWSIIFGQPSANKCIFSGVFDGRYSEEWLAKV